MMGITLSFEEIRRAPQEVRRWLEHEVSTSLGLQVRPADPQQEIARLASCSHGELASMLSLIQGVFPAVNVFFELGRKGASFAQDRFEAYRLEDLQHHTRLQSTDQVMSCLNLINESFQQVRGSPAVSFYGTDGDYCFVATETQQNIRRLWFEMVGHGDMTTPQVQHAAAPTPVSQESMAVGDGLTGSGIPGMQSLQR